VKSQQKKQAAGARRTAARRARIVRWVVGLSLLGAIGYGLAQVSNIAYDETDIAVVDFSDLSQPQKRTALEAANTARCTCGCGMTVAQCVSTDSTCPIRESNITRIKGMVAQARTEG
jgi:hypothetical protein